VIGGLDPCGGAGITADARMAWAHGVHALTVATCLTVQNRHGFSRLFATPAGLLRESLLAAVGDGRLHGVKVGLAGDADGLRLVMEFIAEHLGGLPVVVDPVLCATSGGLPMDGDLVATYRECFGGMTLLTPNLLELQSLAPEGVEQILAHGCPNVLVKGGHGEGAVVEDRLVRAEGETVLRHPRLLRGPVHGTGCALATSVAAHLAAGADLETACRRGVWDVVLSLERTPNSIDGLPVPLTISAARTPV
jgi:hydroxymethylpyrimidine/phosphomethylpyrimidine kinase